MTETPDKESQADASNHERQPDGQPEASSGRFKLAAAVVVSSLALVGAAAGYAWPDFNIAVPNFGSLAELHLHKLTELFPRETASAPQPDPIVIALKDIQSAQQQNASALQENGAVLAQNTITLKQDAANLELLRQNSSAQQTDLKRISNQISLLAARVDSLQNAVAPLTTSSISSPNTHTRSAGAPRRKTSRMIRPVGPVSIGGAPLSPVPPPGWGAG